MILITCVYTDIFEWFVIDLNGQTKRQQIGTLFYCVIVQENANAFRVDPFENN